jgi:MoxR-like ATPase
MVISVLAGEHIALIGPPGTAKSALVRTFSQLIASRYFEYLLTRFTEPSEVLGPIDINELRSDRYIRRERGKLPTARLVFLDEIFKASSAILNALLTVINERKFYQDGVPVPVRLKILFAATNEIPEHSELGALKDRFVLMAACRSVSFFMIWNSTKGTLFVFSSNPSWTERTGTRTGSTAAAPT